MIPYGHQWLAKDDLNEVIKVLKSDWLTQGPKILKFEKKIAKYCQNKYAVVVNSGTAALHLAYLAAGLKRDDEVVTTPNTFASTVNMLLVVGAKPVFCDIRLDSYNIDEAKIEKLITKKTKAIIPIDFAGQPCEIEKILQIAKKHKLLVIEDACPALGAQYKNKKIGAWADLTVFSFHAVKAITTGEGGAILTNQVQLYRKLLLLRNHGIHKDKKGKNVMTQLGYNYRLTDFQAALGNSQLKKVDYFIKKRRQIARWYYQELSRNQNITLPVELKNCYHSWHIYVIRTKKINQRDKLANHLRKKGIGINFHYPAVYSHPYYRRHGFKNFYLKNMEEYQKSCLTLPCYPQLTQTQVKYIAKLIKK